MLWLLQRNYSRQYKYVLKPDTVLFWNLQKHWYNSALKVSIVTTNNKVNIECTFIYIINTKEQKISTKLYIKANFCRMN